VCVPNDVRKQNTTTCASTLVKKLVSVNALQVDLSVIIYLSKLKLTCWICGFALYRTRAEEKKNPKQPIFIAMQRVLCVHACVRDSCAS